MYTLIYDYFPNYFPTAQFLLPGAGAIHRMPKRKSIHLEQRMYLLFQWREMEDQQS